MSYITPIIIGDFNINILDHNLNIIIKYCIDYIYSLSLCPSYVLINKSTRITHHSYYLIDNIVCNK